MKARVASLLHQQAQCVLATVAEKEVALHLMAYAFSEGLEEIYLASLENTQKVKNMRSHPCVTCLWDNRSGNNTDHIEGLAMSGFGRACELSGESLLSARGLLLQRNETITSLLFNPTVVIFALRIDRYQWVEGYTKSMCYKP